MTTVDTTPTPSRAPRRSRGALATGGLAKVPALTALFWVTKLLTTGMGESLADFLAAHHVVVLAVVGGTGLLVALARQLAAPAYRATTYWLAVSMVAVFGTVAADGLRQGLGLSLPVVTGLYAALLAVVLGTWWWVEGTLSVHSITTRRRESFYWLTVLVSFALGTAAGDLTAFYLGWGFMTSILVFGVAIVVPWVLFRAGLMNEVVAFWTAYVLTRPLGASVADWLGKPMGAGFGDGAVSAVAVGLIAALVAYLAVSRRDVQPVA